MKLGKESSCYFDDKIDLELSPGDLEKIIRLVKDRSMEEQNWDFQGLWRELKDYLQRRFDAWGKERKKMAIRKEKK